MRTFSIALVLVFTAAGGARAQQGQRDARSEIEAFNQALDQATRHMDNAATLALWAEDGVSLLPDAKPMQGKAAITAFLNATTASLPAAHMETFELECHDIQVSGDWASEWCTEHQVVRFADKRPPFDGRGNLLFVLHRSNDGHWRIKTEMWNQGSASGAEK